LPGRELHDQRINLGRAGVNILLGTLLVGGLWLIGRAVWNVLNPKAAAKHRNKVLEVRGGDPGNTVLDPDLEKALRNHPAPRHLQDRGRRGEMRPKPL